MTTTRSANVSTEFEGRVAMVTGAARGIGRASAEAFARRGAAVVVCDLLEDDAAQTVKAIEAEGGRAVFVRTDVSRAEDVAAAVDTAVTTFGRLDFAHNNAGTFAPGPLADIEVADWNRVIGANLSGVFYCMKHQIPAILPNRGAIVNTASIWASVGSAGQAVYAASKHGVLGLTRSAAHDYGTTGVRINAVAPGTIETAMTAAVPVEIMEATIARSAQNRYGQPSEIAEAVVWLCSDAASYITGTVLSVDGGWLAA